MLTHVDANKSRSKIQSTQIAIRIFLLAFITALWAWYVQVASYEGIVAAVSKKGFRFLLATDIAAAILVLSLGKNVSRAFFVVQALLSVFILTYIDYLQTPPTLTAVVNGAKFVKGIQVWDYVNMYAVVAALAILFAQWCLSRGLSRICRRTKIVLFCVATVLLSLCHWTIHKKYDIRALLPERHKQFLQKGAFGNRAVDSIFRRGYIATWALELSMGRVWMQADFFDEVICKPRALDVLPELPVTDKIVILQIESLGSELLSTKVNGNEVMPFLGKLLDTSFYMELDGKKVIASSNSDYEMLNTRVAACDAVYYEELTYFPDSMITALKNKGYHTEVYVGIDGFYLNLRRTYALMGFAEEFFREEFTEHGIPSSGDFCGGVVQDRELLAFMSSRFSQMEAPYLQFGITMTMHLLGEQPEREEYKGSPYSGFYSLCRYTDDALKEYMETLPKGTTVIIYGDHASYWGERSGRIPFIVHVTGQRLPSSLRGIPVLTRCEASHYLRKLFGLPVLESAEKRN